MIQFLLSRIQPYKKIIAMAVIFQTIQAFSSLFLPMINASVIDVGIASQNITYILWCGFLMVVVSLVQFVCYGVAIIQGARASYLIGRDLREEVYRKILSFSQREIGTFGAPTLITRATNDVDKVVLFYSTTFTVFLTIPLTFFGGIIMAVIQSIRLSAVLVITIPIILLVSYLAIRRIVPLFRRRQKLTDRVNGILRDQITGVRVVKAFNKEETERKKLDEVNEDFCRLNTSINRLTALLQPLFTIIVNVATIGLLWYGGQLAEGGIVDVGQIVSFITYLALILSSTLMTAMIFILVPQVEISSERIMEILNTKNSVRTKENPIVPENRPGLIEFDDVAYTYGEEGEAQPVIRDISFTAEPGTTTAIIGSTGSGKTTLLNLIPRLADATSGQILVDGNNIQDYPIKELDEMMGLVPQKSFLFKGTLAENLRFAKPDATDEELWEALRIAQIDDFVRNSEKGLDMEVNEGGSNFSGGQRQRFTIARAIVRKPKIYLFDDSFSALDYQTDRNLRQALRENSVNSSIIVISQRIASIRNAEQIIVLNNGTIEDKGTHEELLARSKTYQEIVESQPVEVEARNE